MSGDYSYSTALGYSARATDSNQVALGTAAETVYIPGGKILTGTTKTNISVGYDALSSVSSVKII
jgi:hypothetical protein